MKAQGKTKKSLWVGLTLIVGLAMLTGTAVAESSQQEEASAQGSIIDFEGLAAGTIVDSISSGRGMTGDVSTGVVKVFGYSNRTGLDTNAAMIFDATCPPQNQPVSCTGRDRDLFKPELGKVLIVSEDLDPTDPDDADHNSATLEFDFSGWDSGAATVESLTVMDVEEDQNQGNSEIELYSGGEGGTLLGTVDIPNTGNNDTATLDIGVSGVDFMRIKLNGSGAVDNLIIRPAEVLYLSHVGAFGDGVSSLYLVRIDEANERANLILLPNGVVNYDNVDALAATADGSRLYIIDDVTDPNNPANSRAVLAYYDVATATLTEVGTVRFAGGQKLLKIDQAAFAPDGRFYITSTGTDSLYRMNPGTGVVTLIGKVTNTGTNTPVNIGGGDIAITSDSNMYLWTSAGRPGSPVGLYQVPLTAQNGIVGATFISPSPDGHTTFRGMAVRASGRGDLVRARWTELHIFRGSDGADVIGPFPLYLDNQIFKMGGGDMSIGPFAP